jgi:HEAT repeat protein
MKRAISTWVVVFLLLGVAHAEMPEPSFEGKPLSHWMKALREVPKDPKRASQDWRKAPWVLGRIGVPALPGLIAALDDENPEIRLRAIRPILAMGSTASDAAPMLAELLEDPNPRIRQWSAAALGQIGPSAAGATPGLNAALKDTEPPVRQAAAAALGAIGAVESVPLLRETTNDSSQAVQRAARLALERLEGKPASAQPEPSPPSP